MLRVKLGGGYPKFRAQEHENLVELLLKARSKVGRGTDKHGVCGGAEMQNFLQESIHSFPLIILNKKSR